MDGQEFKVMLQEGEAALERSRQLLRNDPHKPLPWESITPAHITPAQLKPAVEHIRHQFDAAEWQLAMRVECGCYLALHPELAVQAKFKGFQNLIPAEKRAAWQSLYEGIKEPECFKFWTGQFSSALAQKIEEPFNLFLKIALAQQCQLNLPPVEWAKSLTSNLIYALKWTVPHLIKKMCDAQDWTLKITQENFSAYAGWVSWRAPRFVHMQPSGNAIYDPATAWVREDAETTEHLLRGLTIKMLDPATFKVDRLAGEAYVSLACSTPARIAESEKRPRNIVPPTPIQAASSHQKETVPMCKTESQATQVSAVNASADVRVSTAMQTRVGGVYPLDLPTPPDLDETILLAQLEKAQKLHDKIDGADVPAELADAGVILRQFMQLKVLQNSLLLESHRIQEGPEKALIQQRLGEIAKTADKWNQKKNEAQLSLHEHLKANGVLINIPSLQVSAKPELANSTSETRFKTLAPDFRKIVFNGVEYEIGPAPAGIIMALFKAEKNGLTIKEIRTAICRPNGKIQDWFTGKAEPLWGTLVVGNDRGKYWLSIFSQQKSSVASSLVGHHSKN